MNQEFAYGLFYELVGDYQSQNTTQSMDCFSLAIQVSIWLMNTTKCILKKKFLLRKY